MPEGASRRGGSRPVAPRVIILNISGSSDGHRGHYHRFLADILPGDCLRFSWRMLVARQPVLVSMIEESPALYALICLLRALQGKRTAGLLFRPLPALRARGWGRRVKRLVLAGLRKLPDVQTLTILPFSVEPGFAQIADGWIYDPQLWDLFAGGAAPVAGAGGAFADDIRRAAAGRGICAAIGRQDLDKGFDGFVRLYLGEPGLRQAMLFAFGGKVADDLTGLSGRFAAAGGFACDRFISDAELLDLYACADLVWCAYAETYDQASGILGRAVQLGIPVVVRRGSLIHRFCEMEGVGHIALGEDCDAAGFAPLPPRGDAGLAAARAREFGRVSLLRLRAALGLEGAA